jgi:signal transduction histidine kinase
LAQALEEVRRLSGVLEKTLDLNRSERHALQFESLCLAEVVQSVVRRLEPWLSVKQAKLHLVLDPDIYVRGDFASLQNSVQSLLENAVLYNPFEKKEVQIWIEARGNRALLSVLDNGPGICGAERSRIFDRFYRGEGGRQISGTGLGLYLARVIVEAHRGVLRLADAAVQGACFEMDLPRVKTA